MPHGPAILIALIGLVLAFVITMSIRSAHRRRAGIKSFATTHGLIHEKKAEAEFRHAWAVVPELPDRGSIYNLMYGQDGETEYTYFEHTQVVMVGSTPSSIVHTVGSSATDPDSPDMHVLRRNLLKSLLSKAGSLPEVTIDDGTFSRRWIVRCEDPAFATRLLSPPVRAMIDEERKTRGWHIMGGRCIIVCVYSMRAARLEALRTRLMAFADAVQHSLDVVLVPRDEELHDG